MTEIDIRFCSIFGMRSTSCVNYHMIGVVNMRDKGDYKQLTWSTKLSASVSVTSSDK